MKQESKILNNNQSPEPHWLLPLLISGLAFLAFTTLLWLGHIGEVSYCFLVALASLLGIALHGFGRIQELDFKNLRLVLREIEQTKRDLFVREEKLKAIAIPLAQVIALSGASEGDFGNPEMKAIKRKWYQHKLEALTDALKLSSAEAEETQKYMQKYSEIKALSADASGYGANNIEERTKRLNSLNTDLIEMMKADITK